MIKILYIVSLFAATPAFAQKIYEPPRGSAERKQHMEILHKAFDSKFKGQQIVFEASDYKSNGIWAFISIMVHQKNGKPVNFEKSVYKEEWAEGMMDSNGIYVLLKKSAGKWKLIDHFDFPTDVPYGCWWKQHKVPKQIFPYTQPAADCTE